MFFITIKTMYRIGLWALAVLALTLTVIPSAQAVESGGIGGRPAYPKAGNPRSESIFIFTLESGRRGDDGVRINNNTDAEKSIDVYAVDSQVSSGGAFACAQKVDEPHSVGSWIKLEQNQVTLSPKKSEIIPFSLAVPKRTASGEYNGCIVVQEASQKPTAAGNGIALSFRSAIRVAVTVPGDLKKGLLFTRLDSQQTEGDKRVISISLKNQGNVSLDTDVDVTIRSVLWTTMRKVGGTFPVLANGQSDFNFDTTDPFWGGVYFLRARAAYNPDPRAGIGSDDKLAHVTKTKILFTKPKPLAALIELLVVAIFIGAGVLLIKRKRFKREAHSTWVPYRVKEAEHLKHIADRHGIPWQQLASVNKIKPPYTLHKGSVIKIPPPKPSPKKRK
jgi:hypothetical protein